MYSPMQLTTLLGKLPLGPVAAETQIELLKLLAECWSEFQGSADSKMAFWKIGRDDGPLNMVWTPPLLTFVIVRHGATVLGSSRGEKQQWKLNIEKKTAGHCTVGYVQLYPKAPPLKVKPIATKVVDVVKQGPESDSELISNGTIVRKDDELIIFHTKLIPGNGNQMTISGRRKRFRNELTARMAEIGWELVDVRRGMIFKRCDHL